jgi:acetyl esterase
VKIGLEDPGESARMGALLKARGLLGPAMHTVSLQEARERYDALGRFFSADEPALPSERSFYASGPHGPIRCFLYPAEGAGSAPALIYFHGGGFCLGEAAGWHGLMRRLARSARVSIVNVDYPLAPEHSFPIAFEQAVAAVRFVYREGPRYGIDPHRLAVGGDSAGANLALGAACALRDSKVNCLRIALLFYGAYSNDIDSPAWNEFGGIGSGLPRETMGWFWRTYRPDSPLETDWRATPMAAAMNDLPYVYMNVGTHDPLQDDAVALCTRLAEAGTDHRLDFVSGMNHGFIRFAFMPGTARLALDVAAAELRARLT